MNARQLAWILWPSFLAAGAATGVFFTLFDPVDLVIFGTPVTLGRMAAYSIGFFCFWVIAASSSALTCFFQKTAAEINRCPLPPADRPPGCPKRPEDGCC
ncbi:MAG TPA: hypothetical protein VFV71_01045 [Burkholderiales bacterium]|nr:hypothetical protein [Burkholderiales bacterium]